MPPKETEDPVIAMLDVGKQIWERESGDNFIERLRSEILDAARPTARTIDGRFVGNRLGAH